MTLEPEATTDRAREYAEREKRFGADVASHGARSRLVSNLRGLAFAAVALPGFFLVFGTPPTSLAIVPVVALLAFVALVVLHSKVLLREDDAKRMLRVNNDARARCEGRWRDLADDGAAFAKPDHPLADDLDLFGRGSLFQRVCTAHTHFGQAELARMLDASADATRAAERQDAVRALAPELEMRQRLEALSLAVVGPPKAGAKVDRPVADAEPLLAWAEGAPSLLGRGAVKAAAFVLPVLTVGAIVTSAVFGLPSLVWISPILASIALLYVVRRETATVFAATSSIEGAFLRYGPMLELLENVDVDSTVVRGLRERLLSGDGRPSTAMREFQRALSWFELRHNGLVHPVINALLVWDVHCVLRLEAWQKKSGRALRGWFEALGKFEALSSFAALAHDEPTWAWPELQREQTLFIAEALGHPLIDREKRVTNDVSLDRPGTALLVTGSNMSGKSTMLRAMGLALVMTLAGAPVCAARLRTSSFALGSSIRVRDSLEGGVSHFYAEVRKLKLAVDGADGERPLLFLLDEILHGTNSRERQIGARHVLARLLERGAIGAVSTHDEGLCELEPELAVRVRQVHFRESVQDDTMTFDYRLREGPVTSGNALRLMRLVGIDVPLPTDTPVRGP